MRAEAAPFLVDLALALAGLGLLSATSLAPRTGWQALGALGLGYMLGTAAVPLALSILLTVGVPFSLWSFLAVVVLCFVAGATRFLRRGDRLPFPAIRIREPRGWTASTWVAVAFVVIFGAYFLVGFMVASDAPLSAWDAWTIWARKAQQLTAHDTLVEGFYGPQIYYFSHVDYPLQLPIWEALHFRARGGFDTTIVLRHVWLLLGAFVWSAAYLLRRHVTPLVWGPVLLLVAVAPGVWQQLLTGYADVPMAMFVCLGALCLALWLAERNDGLLAIAALLLIAAANTKNEGLAASIALLVAAGAVAFFSKLPLRPLVLTAAGVVLLVLPWRIWTAAHGIKGDLPLPDGLKPSYLVDHFDRVHPAISAINHQLAAQGTWLFLLPLAFLVIATCLWSGIGRRIAAFYLSAFALVWVVFVWVYWTSKYEIDWYLRFSADRVVDALLFICVAALLHLSGLLVQLGTGAPDPRREPPV